MYGLFYFSIQNPRKKTDTLTFSKQNFFKRFFIYSSLGHVGFMILGVAVLNYSGIQGAIDYLILYGILL